MYLINIRLQMTWQKSQTCFFFFFKFSISLEFFQIVTSVLILATLCFSQFFLFCVDVFLFLSFFCFLFFHSFLFLRQGITIYTSLVAWNSFCYDVNLSSQVSTCLCFPSVLPCPAKSAFCIFCLLCFLYYWFYTLSSCSKLAFLLLLGNVVLQSNLYFQSNFLKCNFESFLYHNNLFLFGIIVII